jgi:hypothetical protein
MRVRTFAAVAASLCCLVSSPAQAFKTKTHVIIANEVLEGVHNDQFGGLHADDLGYQAEVRQALLDHPEAFRAGTLGPDNFPDMIAGQLWVHANQGEDAEGPKLDNSVSFESRNVEDWRSIDYGMYMLRRAYEFEGDPVERSKAIAFAYGYLGHMIGDAFAHSTINEWAGGAWSLEFGQGTFGPLTEEIKHLTTEALIDDMLPQSNPVDLKIETPRAFLHQILTEQVQDGLDQTSEAGAFGGKYYKILTNVRNTLDRLSKRENWTDNDFLDFGLDVMSLHGDLATANTGVGDPIADIEHFFAQRALLFNAVLERWVWLNECLAQNYVLATNLESGGLPRVHGGRLTVDDDACDDINFEPEVDPGDALEIGSLYGGDLNRAAHTELGDLGTMEDGVLRMEKFLEVAITELVSFDPLRDIGSLNTIAEFLDPCEPMVNWDTCADACHHAEDVCTTVNQTASCIACFSGFIPACALCDEDVAEVVFNPGCQAAVDATSFQACNVCTESPACEPAKKVKALHDLLDTQLDALVAQALTPLRDQIIEDVGQAVFRDHFDEVKGAVELYEMRRTKGGSVWLVNFVYLPEDLRAGGIGWLRELFVSGMNVASAVVTPATTPTALADATFPAASARQPQISRADYGDLVAYLWDAAHGQVVDPLVAAAQPWVGRLGAAVPDSVAESSAAKIAQVLDALGLVLERPGPTARAMLTHISASTVNPDNIDGVEADLYAYSPTHNAMGLTWRSLLNVPDDMVSEFLDHGSEICLTNPNIACDGISSLDDPNHHLTGDVPMPGIATNSEFDQKLGNYLGTAADASRSFYAWGAQEIVWQPGRIGPVEECSLGRTAFVATETRDLMLSEYLNVYDGPENCEIAPGFGSIGSPLDVADWQPTPNGTRGFIDDGQGGGAMEVCGNGFVTLTSPAFNTTDWPAISHQLAFDVKIPNPPANPYWWGSARLQVNIPSAGLNNAWIGEKHLTGTLVPGQWTTLVFDLPPNVYQALAADHPNAQFYISLNGVTPGKCWAIDELRFVGDVEFRDGFHMPGPSTNPLATNNLLSFENQADWSAPGAVTRRVTDRVTHGSAAFGIVGSGYKLITSRPFSTTELRTVGTELGLDVYIPNPQPNQYWVGAVQLFLTCPTANIYNQYLGQQDLTHLFPEEFNTLKFPLTPAVRTALLGNHSNCRISIALNVNNGSGEFVIDRLGFGGVLTNKP